MSTSLGVILKRLAIVFAVAGILLGITLIFSYDIIKIDWPSFMEIQPAYKQMEHPLPVPERSIPVEGPVFVPNSQVLPKNPTKADAASLARGQELYVINCKLCHGETGEGNGPVAPFLTTYKPANLTSPLIKAFSDGQIFMTITNGVPDRMPPLNENLTVSERWDVVNFVRTLKPAQQ
jgi:mono/diheme cytochrome c family protein